MNIKDLPPDLPPVPSSRGSSKQAPPPVPPAKRGKSRQKKRAPRSAAARPKIRMGRGSLLLLVGAGLWSCLVMFWDRDFGVGRSPDDVTLRAIHSQLEKIPLEEGLVVKLRKLAGKDVFILLSNYDQESFVELKMTGLDGRLLGPRPVQFTSRGLFRDGLVYFREFNLIQGLVLTSGEYQYKISFTSLATGDRQVHEGKILLSHQEPEAFAKSLKSYHAKMKKKYVDPLKEKLNRYQTFSQLAMQSLAHYKSVIAKIAKGPEITQFEALYNESVGPFLRDLIIDANRLHMSYLNVDPERSKSYEDVLDFGKRVGEMASDMVTETRKIKKLSADKRAQLIERFSKIYENMTYEVEDEKKIIERELKKYSTYVETP